MNADEKETVDLLCDVGNSRIKWACARGGIIDRHGAVDAADELLEQLGDRCITRLALAASGEEGRASSLLSRLGRRWPGVTVYRARTRSRYGALINSYTEPGRMGVDRWLGMIAAWQATRSACCVIDAGTAVTVDVIDDGGRHLGGWIAPGLALMRQSLASRTARIGSDFAPSPGAWGRSTGEAVHCGTRAALGGTVGEALARLRHDCPQAVVFVTGGDAPLIAQQVESEVASVSIVPLLVLLGLQHCLNSDDSAACSPD